MFAYIFSELNNCFLWGQFWGCPLFLQAEPGASSSLGYPCNLLGRFGGGRLEGTRKQRLCQRQAPRARTLQKAAEASRQREFPDDAKCRGISGSCKAGGSVLPPGAQGQLRPSVSFAAGWPCKTGCLAAAGGIRPTPQRRQPRDSSVPRRSP